MRQTVQRILSACLISCLVAGVRADAQDPGLTEGLKNHGPVYPEIPEVPDTLIRPQNEEWVRHLQGVLYLELLSLRQYQDDREKFDTDMPYRMVVPLKEQHIKQIMDLLWAYGASVNVGEPEPKMFATMDQAYEYGLDLLAELIDRYERLLRGAEDDTARRVLENLLLQTRLQQAMFQHARQMRRITVGGLTREG